jgi:carboxypeptidase Taq
MEQLRVKLGEIADINSSISLLHWDQEVNMPPKAAEGRGQQLATLSALSHRLFTDPEIGKTLNELQEQSDKLSPDEAKLISETLYDYKRAVKLPESFVHEFAEEQSKAFEAWVQARKTGRFAGFLPHLEKLVDLLKQKADLLGYEGSPYNALLESYERGMTTTALKSIFATLAEKQSALVKRIVESSRQPDVQWTKQGWDEQKQWDFTLRVLRDMGYDFEAGRQDKSVHPFTTNFDLYDVRITTRINPNDLFSALTGSIHEGGHALYEQGFRPQDRRTVLAEAISLGIHESQSRMWENMIGRSLPFWKHYTPLLREHYPGQLDSITAEQVYAAINRVRPSFIRVEADECTYNLHIILRFEIETALIEGNLNVADIPELWNAKVKKYLGLVVPNDSQGCLQDIHWSHGSMGYFPTYTLGNLYAAQMFERMEQDLPDLWTQIENGRFESLLQWLRKHVHEVGRRITAPELIRDISGKEVGCDAYLNYLKNKYVKLYF